MKKQNSVINLCVIGLLWFSLAFACNNGNDRGKTASYDETTPTRQTRQNTSSELTEQDVRDYFIRFSTERCESAVLDCKVIFDSPIQIGAATRRSIEGGLPPPEGGRALAYPVTVDYSVYKASKNDHSNPFSIHNRGGSYYFFRDVNLVWNSTAGEGVTTTYGNEQR